VKGQARASWGGFELTLELGSRDLLPGRLVDGRLVVGAPRGGSFRGARVTLVGTERWRYDQTTTDAEGRTRTETRTAEEDLPKVPIAVLGATSLAPGERREIPFQVPVPGLGPPTFEGTELAVSWELRANLDVGGIDPGVELPVRVLQPTSLLRAGVVGVAQFALFDEADVAAGDLAGSIRLEPVPLCVGAPFEGALTIAAGSPRRVQEIRLELRVTARSTVGGGREESVTLWAGRLAGEGQFGGAGRYPFAGTLADLHLPTLRTPHGRADAAVHVVVATAWARDPHLVRDVAVCSTTEL
jgi:hypothetical protein